MTLRRLEKRSIVSYARSEAFAPGTVGILGKLGYDIVGAERALEGASVVPDLCIVDERRIGELADEHDSIPLILLTGRHGVTGADSRIVGALKRPAGLHDLYRLLQQIFEDHPRTTPRIPVHLRARCRRQDRQWRGSVLSLSENGCLLRSPEPLPLGTQIQLSFVLPRCGEVELWAETAYQLVPDLGLVFSALAPAHRDAISEFVTETLGSSATLPE